jgi:small subunit ribosomal protein S5
MSRVDSSKNKSQDTQITESLLSVSRVTKVVEGGRVFSFSAYVVVGNREGVLGFAKGKANEVSDARTKAVNRAKKNMHSFPLYQKRTIHHDVEGKSGSTKILLRRAKPGTGIIAGQTARAVLFHLGVRDIVAKSHGSSNVHTTVRAVLDALKKLESPRDIANRRGISVADLSVHPNKKLNNI